MTKSAPRSSMGATPIITIIGVVLLAIGAYSLVSYIRYESAAEHADGSVVRVNVEHKRSGGRRGANLAIERPVVKFQLPTGATMSATAKVPDSLHHYSVGDVIPIEFDPARPEESLRVAGGPSWLDLGLGLLGAAMLTGAALSLRRDRLVHGGSSGKKRGSDATLRAPARA